MECVRILIDSGANINSRDVSDEIVRDNEIFVNKIEREEMKKTFALLLISHFENHLFTANCIHLQQHLSLIPSFSHFVSCDSLVFLGGIHKRTRSICYKKGNKKNEGFSCWWMNSETKYFVIAESKVQMTMR